jgi:hypothetical protein
VLEGEKALKEVRRPKSAAQRSSRGRRVENRENKEICWFNSGLKIMALIAPTYAKTSENLERRESEEAECHRADLA